MLYELQEEIARVLKVCNTRLPDSLVEWSWKLREYIKVPPPPNLITVFDISGTVLYKEIEETKPHFAAPVIVDDTQAEVEDASISDKPQADLDDQGEGEYEGEQDIELEGEPEPDIEEIKKPKSKKLPNQFNFCERAALTYTYPVRDMSTQTIPPPTATFVSHVFQWAIFDDYQEDYAQQQREKEKEKKLPSSQLVKKEDIKKKEIVESEITQRMLQAAKTLERMVNQNIFDEISQDYRYWNDPSDEFKDGEGSLLPLWKFNFEETKRHDITDMCFNKRYYDLFAVSFGSMSFNSSVTNGAVCLFTLKNPSYPEWICHTESPAMCVDFNIEHPHLLILGTTDGSVEVHNVMLSSKKPQYRSNDITQKHGGTVWEVQWAPDTEEGNLAFYSVSIDGKINYWILNQNDLGLTTVMTLYLNQAPIPGPDGTMITLKGCGTCLAFYPESKHIFLVGTEEGTIYKCNTAYSSIYMKTYDEAHNMPIYRIVFNKYNSNIFASCSGDWRIKIWEDDRPDPLFIFDLGVPIGDVQWAPYSSTVLACVSNDGKVTVFDLNVNKYKPICSQFIVSKRKSKLTRLAFNEVLPFIIAGDDKGTIHTLKLSPNLRIQVKPTKKQIHLSQRELEILKLDKLLSFIREPPTLTPPKDIKISS
ncbi:dynein intermediate chain 2, ciliary isoform X2 [Prorops nasuta]|uniref:dynein intermediate chain 2, ciliary isoform X2 n=1 Tax=Prorops nasuta TaxID=863751 RepID=UPI0034CDB5D9